MEAEYIELVLNDRLIRIDKNDSMNVWSWRDWVKTPYWFKMKINLHTDNKTGYKSYRTHIYGKYYNLSRVVYKAHHPEWDITDTSKNNFIDHKNTNPLDNRIENLRILTHQQNQWNTNAKGYTWHKKANKWEAQIAINYKSKSLGYFTEEADARQAYLNAKELYHKLPA